MSDFFKLDANELTRNLTRNLAFKNSEEYMRRYKNKLCNNHFSCKNEAKYTVLKNGDFVWWSCCQKCSKFLGMMKPISNMEIVPFIGHKLIHYL